jgi:nucleoside-diphosphate-sugar epimerase
VAWLTARADKDDSDVHNNNVQSSYNGFRAAIDAGIKKVAFASSVNALGLLYGVREPSFDYFPIDE